MTLAALEKEQDSFQNGSPPEIAMVVKGSQNACWKKIQENTNHFCTVTKSMKTQQEFNST